MDEHMQSDDWRMFTNAWLEAMRGFQDEKLTMDQALLLIGDASLHVDDEIEQFACNVISEIGGFPIGYAQTMSLLGNNPTRDEVLRFMNS